MLKKFVKLFLILLVIFGFVFFTSKFFINNKSAEAATKQEITDPDLDLSIEELRKKYPIDWLEKKYGDSRNPLCEDGDDEPMTLTTDFWPCGIFCKNRPELKNCSKKCYNRPLPQNLICTFFVPTTFKFPDRGAETTTHTPVAEFKDFSINEIKSAFLYYNDPKNAPYESKTRDPRAEEIVAIAFIYFINTPERSLNDEERRLKSFVYSKKISSYFILDKEMCNYFAIHSIGTKISESQRKNFCSNF